MDVTILGAGVIGLLSALALTDAGYKVTIVARDLPGDESQDWASPWAGAAIFPYSDSEGHSLQVESFKYFWALAHRDPTSGVQVVKATEFYDDRDDDSTVWYKSLVPQYRRIPTEDLPKGVKVGFTYKTMTVNPVVFLPWVRKQLEARGVCFIRKEVSEIEEVKRITGNEVIVHATGLGAYNLADDKDVVAHRGQTMFVKTDFDELMMLQGSQYTYIIPRMHSGGVIIGGISQEGNLDREVDQKLRPDILARVQNISKNRLESVDLESPSTKNIVAFRPGRKGGYRLESEGKVVHAYGFGGMGYIYGYGAALEVRGLVEAMMKLKPPRSRL
ncbi:uncharacterized protein N7443_004612 [Penicillium atrosanguineum]|uniref:uncharacterized protein n=1 Tax=Penicillium atrosanguineum TaxID=1132637 RepID=UPI002391C3FD|nr:uncharacterized protein N7443_004612 [Penicillium atrosanguineum]KAJ5304952.1 hypothetical protein N7443_004612 [Penicillium atrosanguineum]